MSSNLLERTTEPMDSPALYNLSQRRCGSPGDLSLAPALPRAPTPCLSHINSLSGSPSLPPPLPPRMFLTRARGSLGRFAESHSLPQGPPRLCCTPPCLPPSLSPSLPFFHTGSHRVNWPWPPKPWADRCVPLCLVSSLGHKRHHGSAPHLCLALSPG